MINEVIEEQAVEWYLLHGLPPHYAFVHPNVYRAMLLEAQMEMDKWNRKGISILQFVTSVGVVTVQADDTIDTVDASFVSSNREDKYLDYIVEKLLLEPT